MSVVEATDGALERGRVCIAMSGLDTALVQDLVHLVERERHLKNQRCDHM